MGDLVVLDSEKEKASNAYVMSILAITVGLPLPIFNLAATVIFYFANKKSTYFVKWHCTQALITQLLLFFFNSFGFWWAVRIFLDILPLSQDFLIYISIVIFVNILEIIASIYAAIYVKKNGDYRVWFISDFVDYLIKQPKSE